MSTRTPFDRVERITAGQNRLQKRLVRPVMLWTLFFQLAFVIGFSLLFVNGYNDFERLHQYTDMIYRVNDLQTALVDQDTGQRGYLLTGDSRFLETYNHGLQVYQSVSIELMPMAQKLGFEEQFKGLKYLGQVWQEQFAKPLIAERSNNQTVSLDTLLRSKEAVDQFRSAFTDMERDMGTQRNQVEVRFYEEAIGLMILILLMTMILGAFMILQLVKRIRSVTVPLKHMTHTAGRWTLDDLETPFPYQERQDELGELAVSLEHMRSRLQAQYGRIQQSEKRYASLFEHNLDGVVILDMNGSIVTANPSVEGILGYSVEELQARKPSSFIHPEDLDMVLALYEEVFEGRQRRLECRMIAKDGGTVHLQINVFPVIVQETMEGVYVVLKDVTMQTRIQSALMESNDRINTILESITDAFISLNDEWRFVYINREAKRYLNGMGIDVLAGRNILEVFPNIQETGIDKRLKFAMENKTSDTFDAFFPKNERWFDVRVYPTPTGLSVYFRDITDNKHAEEALRLSEERYRMLAHSITDVISQRDKEGRLVYVSPSSKRMLGYEIEELIGKPVYELIHPEDMEMLQTATDQVMADREVKQVMYRERKKDGSWIWVESILQPVITEKGHSDELIAVSRDMTVRKMAEEKMSEANQLLTRLSSIDGLTGVGNRRLLDETLEREIQERHQTGEPLTLILLDVDHFKAYNDTYGHLGGDNCLKHIAEVLKRLFPHPDLPARYGGEEFAVVLPGKTLNEALSLAEQLREAVEALAIPHVGSTTSRIVTISIGIAAVEPDQGFLPSVTELVSAADKALYEAKQTRNTVVVTSG